MDDDRELPTTNQPLNAEPRPKYTPLLAVLALFATIALIFAVLMYLRYNT